MFNEHDFNLFIVEGCDTKEIILSVKACEKINCMNLKTILSKSYNNGIIHTIESKAVQTFSFINELYYLLGESRIDYKYFGLNSFYKEYTAFNDNRQYNKFITLMCYSYYLGFHNKKIKDINKIMDRNMYHKEKVLILSKLIKNTGGVQKTSLQLMETLDYKFNVDIFSVQMKDQDFDLKTNYLNMNIPNKFILKIRREQEIIDHINNADYKYIIVNKLNEVFKFTDKINKKIQIIVHNPKDPLNEMIIKNQQYVEKCHVLTNYHKNLMKYLGFNKSLKTYNNYVFKESEMCKTHVKKSTFSNNICFVGRLSKEKNIPLLIKSFNVFNSIKKEMKLYIIGSGRKYKNDNPNIIFTGLLTFAEICKYFELCDYTISSSFIEGKPFSVIEGMSYGLPCIHSNLVGINDVISEEQTGFLFDLEGYDEVKFDFDFDFFDKITKNDMKNKENMVSALFKAYSISFEKYGEISKNCINLSRKYFTREYTIKRNLKNIIHP